MPRRGPKAKSAEIVALRGTAQACRPRGSTEAKSDESELVKPAWLKGRGAKIWAEKVAVYRDRGQVIAGFEMNLAQYCAVEAGLIGLYSKGLMPSTAMVREHRMWAAEFYDTPASAVGRPSGGEAKGNPFGRNGKRP
jgi:hypothetical protein